MIFRVIGAVITACIITVVLRSYRAEYGMLVSLCSTAVIFIWFADYIEQGINHLNSIIESFAIPSQSFGVLIKCLGITVISKISSDICLDCNQQAMASKIEICSKIAVLITATPIFAEVLNTITAFL